MVRMILESTNETRDISQMYQRLFNKFSSHHKIYAYEYVGMAIDAKVAMIRTNDW